jgi:hypothetical protein
LHFDHLKCVILTILNHLEAKEQSRNSFFHAGVTTTGTNHDRIIVHNTGTLDVEAVNIMLGFIAINKWRCVLVGLRIRSGVHLQSPGHLCVLSGNSGLSGHGLQIHKGASKVKRAVKKESEHGAIFPVASNIASNVVTLGQLGADGPRIGDGVIVERVLFFNTTTEKQILLSVFATNVHDCGTHETFRRASDLLT